MALLVSLAAAAGAAAKIAGQSEAPTSGVTRVERTVGPDWEARCDLDACGVVEFVSVPVDTPSDVALVDVTVTVTVDYDTSAGDFGEIDVVIVSDDGTRTGMRPGAFRLAPAGRGATTTLTWSQRRLPAAGATYTFGVGVASREGGGDPRRNRVTGRRATAVVEVWSSG